MTTQLPEPHDYAGLSRHFIRQADDELAKGDHLQAAEKGWGAVAHALKSIAEQRGWNHNKHLLLHDTAMQLFDEFDKRELSLHYYAADSLHQNFYANILEWDEVQRSVEVVKELLAELETMKNSPPRPFTPQNHSQRRRLDRLERQV